MSKNKRAFRFFMSFVLVVSTVLTGIIPSSAEGSTFKDVPSDAYYAEAVGWAVEKDITKGTSATTFSPDVGCTRGQCVTFLYRYAGSPKVEAGKASKFTDVKSDAFYASAVAWAVENGITSGTSEITFSPDKDCTRAQIVTFLWRYMKEPKVSQAASFEDVKSEAYYADAVSWAVEQNITKGTSGTTFSPDKTCTRAQIVTFLWRLDNPGGDSKPGTVDIGKANIGDYVTFGHYEQDNNTANGKEAIEWKVLDKKNGRALLLSKYGLDHKKYNEKNTYVTWETCTLRSWLNSDFLNSAFTSSEKPAIPTVTLSNPDNPIFGTDGGNNTNDRVFLLSLQEVKQYFNLSDAWTDYDKDSFDVNDKRHKYIGGSKDVITSPTAYAEAQGVWTSTLYHDAEGKKSCEWWLRSPGDANNFGAYVSNYGGVLSEGSFVGGNQRALRPALWVNLES